MAAEHAEMRKSIEKNSRTEEYVSVEELSVLTDNDLTEDLDESVSLQDVEMNQSSKATDVEMQVNEQEKAEHDNSNDTSNENSGDKSSDENSSGKGSEESSREGSIKVSNEKSNDKHENEKMEKDDLKLNDECEMLPINTGGMLPSAHIRSFCIKNPFSHTAASNPELAKKPEDTIYFIEKLKTEHHCESESATVPEDFDTIICESSPDSSSSGCLEAIAEEISRNVVEHTMDIVEIAEKYNDTDQPDADVAIPFYNDNSESEPFAMAEIEMDESENVMAPADIESPHDIESVEGSTFSRGLDSSIILESQPKRLKRDPISLTDDAETQFLVSKSTKLNASSL